MRYRVDVFSEEINSETGVGDKKTYDVDADSPEDAIVIAFLLDGGSTIQTKAHLNEHNSRPGALLELAKMYTTLHPIELAPQFSPYIRSSEPLVDVKEGFSVQDASGATFVITQKGILSRIKTGFVRGKSFYIVGNRIYPSVFSLTRDGYLIKEVKDPFESDPVHGKSKNV